MGALDPGIITNLENAAEIFLADPSRVKESQRKDAEKIFLELRHTKSPFQLCQTVLENTQNEFVIYQTATAVKEAALKEWAILDSQTLQSLWQYLLVFASKRPQLSGFAQSELLQCIACILKRGTFDKKAGEMDVVFTNVREMVSSGDIAMQSLGCQTLLNLCNEYCTSWRSSGIGITWDFHVRAKRAFEATSLKKVLELVLQVLHTLVSNSNFASSRENVVLCNRLLCVAESVVSWHFGSRLLPKRLTFAIEFAPAASLRPPATWKDVFLDENVLGFFFQLHSQVRHNTSLSHHSLQCLSQLGSLTGEILSDSKDQDRYLLVFTQKFLELYGESGPMEHEILSVCTMLQKFLTYHPLPSILRMVESSMGPFLQFITDLAVQLCPKAAQEIWSSDEKIFTESLTKILDGWVVLLKAEVRMIKTGLFTNSAVLISKAFLTAFMSPPVGTRGYEQREEEINEDLDEDDRDEFAELLGDMGVIGRHCLSLIIPDISLMLDQRLNEFIAFLPKLTQPHGQFPETTLKQLHVWQEDMHWLFMLIGYLLVGEDCDRSCVVHTETLFYLKNFENTEQDVPAATHFLMESLVNPTNSIASNQMDPVTKIIGRVYMWGSLEENLLCSGQQGILSPQLAQTSLWLLKRVALAFYTPPVLPDSRPSSPQLPGFILPKQAMRGGSELSQRVVTFLVRKCFSSLRLWTGEIRVTTDAVAVLEAMAEFRAAETCESGNILEEMQKVELERMQSEVRKDLLRALVLLGASTDNNAVQQQMYLSILEPLMKRFEGLGQLQTVSGSDEAALMDVLDCFSGIADASQTHSAPFLFEYLCPVLTACVPLMERFKDRLVIVNGVLSLYKAVTKQMAIHLEAKQDSMKLYGFLLELLKVYARSQKGKFMTKELEEEKASDLVLVMEILSNILSKDLLIFAATDDDGDQINSAAEVALLGLDVVAPLMSEELLRFPTLCSRYFQLILFITEMFPENIVQLPTHMLENIFQSIKLSFTGEYGNEVMKSGLELVNVLSTFTCQSSIGSSPQIKASMNMFIKPVFQMCLSTSSDVDIFGDASVTMYSLICCDQAAYFQMVQGILDVHPEPRTNAKLKEAFQILLPPDQVAQPIRKEKRIFRDKLEKFLDDVQGLISDVATNA